MEGFNDILSAAQWNKSISKAMKLNNQVLELSKLHCYLHNSINVNINQICSQSANFFVS